MPNAPAFMPSSTKLRILSSSAGVGRLFARPSTASRTDPCPMNVPMLIDFCGASSLSRNGAERNRRAAVGSFDHRRDALPDVVVRGRQLEDVLARVVVDVDEPGRHDLTARVDHARGRLGNRRCNERDRVAAHADIGAIPRAAGSVDDAAVPDDEVERLRRLGVRGSACPASAATVHGAGDCQPRKNDSALLFIVDSCTRNWMPRQCCRCLCTRQPADTDTTAACDRLFRQSDATRRSAPARCPSPSTPR